MNSTLKVLVPIVLLMGVVFAVTFFAQYTPTEPGAQPEKMDEGTGENPLRFFTTIRRWDPFNPEASLQNRIFPGYFETGETQHAATFWFENRNPGPVRMQLRGVSCAACSGGRLAPIPPDAARLLLQSHALAALPIGPVAGAPAGMAGAAAHLFTGLAWQGHEFSKDPSQVVFTIPAAANTDGWSPQLGILELNFKVRPNPRVPLEADFATQVQGSDRIGSDKFSIWFEPAAAFDLDRAVIDVGELTDTSVPQTHGFTIYSATRTAEEMPSLTVRVLPPGGGSESDPFVTAGTPVPLAPAALDQFAIDMSAKVQRPVRVRSAYRVAVTVRPRVGDALLDIGRLERDIWVSVNVPGTDPKRVEVKGNVRGVVYLTEGEEANLGTFPFARGVSRQFGVSTRRPGIELGVVEEECRPKFMKVSLEKRPDRGGLGQYDMRVTIPGNEQQGVIVGGVVVLEVKGPNPQPVRIPVKGQGTR